MIMVNTTVLVGFMSFESVPSCHRCAKCHRQLIVSFCGSLPSHFLIFFFLDLFFVPVFFFFLYSPMGVPYMYNTAVCMYIRGIQYDMAYIVERMNVLLSSKNSKNIY